MRLRRLATILALVCGAVGAARASDAPLETSRPIVVGFVSVLEPTARHVNVGSTIFTDFDLERSDQAWGLDERFFHEIEALAPRGPDVRWKRIEAPAWMYKAREDLVAVGWSSLVVGKSVKKDLAKLAQQEGIDVLLVMHPWRAQAVLGLNPTAAGYGVATNCTYGRCYALPLLNFSCSLFELRPEVRLMPLSISGNGNAVPEVERPTAGNLTGKEIVGELKPLAADYFELARKDAEQRISTMVPSMLIAYGLAAAPVPATAETAAVAPDAVPAKPARVILFNGTTNFFNAGAINVTLDGRLLSVLGQNRYLELELPRGKHTFHLMAPGAPAVTSSHEVEVQGDEVFVRLSRGVSVNGAEVVASPPKNFYTRFSRAR